MFLRYHTTKNDCPGYLVNGLIEQGNGKGKYFTYSESYTLHILEMN